MAGDQQIDVVVPSKTPIAPEDPSAKLSSTVATTPPPQQDMNAGTIAFKLGLAPLASDYHDGTVTPAWVKGRSENAEEWATAAEAASQDDQERVARVHELDKSCLDSMLRMVNAGNSLSTISDWKRMLLLDNETEIMSLPCVAFHGMPSASHEANAGKSMVMLSKVDKDGASPTYRLHFCITCASASLKAEETWGKQTSGGLCCKRTSQNAKADHASTHTHDMKFVTLNVEGNLFHVHGGCEDSATLASRFGGSRQRTSRCPSLCCLPERTRCPCFGCVSCSCRCSRNSEGHWRASTSFEESLRSYIERIVEESSKLSTYTFPKMDSVSDRKDQALVTKQLHCVQFVYRDTATNSTQSCTAVIQPDEPISNIAKFVSKLSLQLTADPAKAKSDPWSFANPLKGFSVGKKW